MSDATVAIVVSGAVELAKLGLQLWFAQAKLAGLTAEEIEALLNSERERFKRNIATPLPDI